MAAKDQAFRPDMSIATGMRRGGEGNIALQASCEIDSTTYLAQ